MKNKNAKLLAFGSDFMRKMKDNNIWFSADAEMILGSKIYGGFLPWIERFQVIMTPESFTKLQRLFPNNIVSSYYSEEYNSLVPSFVENRKNWKKDQPFVQIKIVVPTVLKKIKKFRSRFKGTSNKRKITTRNAINELYDQSYQGFFVLESRSAKIYENWIPNITFETIDFKFENIEIPVIKEWEVWLKSKFGKDYMDWAEPDVAYRFPAPLKIIKGVN